MSQALPSTANAYDFRTDLSTSVYHRFDYGVQAGDIATARKNSNTLCHHAMYDNNMTRAAFLLPIFLVPLAQAQDLPDAKGKDVTNKICGSCHEAGVVSKYRNSQDDWLGIVDDMKGRGADGSDEDFRTIVAYLTHFFGPDVNVNKANSKELQTQLEISSKEADAIVQYRQGQGDFKSFADLKKVPGLEMSKIEPLQQRIVFR
jgi:competence ComEA-like helix-hairpin-helix protein